MNATPTTTVQVPTELVGLLVAAARVGLEGNDAAGYTLSQYDAVADLLDTLTAKAEQAGPVHSRTMTDAEEIRYAAEGRGIPEVRATDEHHAGHTAYEADNCPLCGTAAKMGR